MYWKKVPICNFRFTVFIVQKIQLNFFCKDTPSVAQSPVGKSDKQSLRSQIR